MNGWGQFNDGSVLNLGLFPLFVCQTGLLMNYYIVFNRRLWYVVLECMVVLTIRLRRRFHIVWGGTRGRITPGDDLSTLSQI
jgi:hypothetical protein